MLRLVGIFRYRFNTQNKLQRFLSDQAFGVFVLHASVLIAISMLMKEIVLHPVLKFVTVFLLAVSVSFMISWLLRRIPLIRRILS